MTGYVCVTIVLEETRKDIFDPLTHPAPDTVIRSTKMLPDPSVTEEMVPHPVQFISTVAPTNG